MGQKHVEMLRDAIAKAAKEYGIHGSEVSKAHLEGVVSDWTFKRSGGLELVKSAYFPLDQKDLAGIAKAKKQLGANRSAEKEKSFEQEFLQDLEKLLTSIKVQKIKPFKIGKKNKISRAVNVVLSDLHFGSDLESAETGGLQYKRIEEARRFAKVIKEVIEYKPQYRNDTELNVMLLGDVIQNALHDPRDGAPLAEQFARALHILTQGLLHLASHYPKVTVYCATGNHGRNTARHKSRAVNQKWDSNETMLYYALSKALPQIKFVIPKTPHTACDILGHKMFLTHGDTVLKPGYPNKAIQTESLEKQINKINASLNDDNEYKVFIVGHVHVGSVTHLSNGATMITNGATVPSDEFAVSIGLLENSCGQMMFETVPGYAVGDVRFIRVDHKDDKDKSLDAIIKAYEGLDGQEA